jgi:hypothetical protein
MNVGDVVTVQVRDFRNAAAYCAGVIREWNQYTGTIVPNLKGFGNDVFCLSTGDAKFPVRVIEKDRCKTFFQSYLPTPTASSKKLFSVKGSKPGSSYTVTCDGSHWSCTCVGFGFRKDCKHIRECK